LFLAAYILSSTLKSSGMLKLIGTNLSGIYFLLLNKPFATIVAVIVKLSMWITYRRTREAGK
jgi:hypothetical protein